MSDSKTTPPTSHRPTSPRSRPPRPTSSKPLLRPGSTSGTLGPDSRAQVPKAILPSRFTKPTTEGYPATEAIKYLIEVVGRDVVSFRRNTQVSFMLIDRARDLCDAINSHIKKTENGTDWASFEKYTDALDPVEEVLFKLVATTEDERTSYLIEGESVQDCIVSVNNWAANREELWTALDYLETTTELRNLFSGVDVPSRQAERQEARTHDDKTFLKEVIEASESSHPGFRVTVPHYVTTLYLLLDKISTGAIPPAVVSFTLKMGLLVQGVARLAFRTPSLDQSTITHLRSAPVWTSAYQLIELLNSTSDDRNESMDRLRLKYEEFLSLLNKVGGKDLEVPESYMELLKLAGKVRRPFHSQAVALISLCRMLVIEFEKEAYRTPDNLVILEDTFRAILDGLQEAVAAVTELKKFNLVNFEDHPAYKSLTRAQTHIKDCHKSFGLGDWHQWELFIVHATRKDKERMERLNALLDTRPPLMSEEQIELTLDVCERSTSTVLHQAILSVEGSVRLSAVRWTVATGLEESLRRRVRQSGEFLLLPDAVCQSHDSVSQLAGNNKSLSLLLMV